MAHFRDERFVRERERSPSRDRTPAFLRDVRRPNAGPMVLRHRSPSPVFERQQIIRRGSPSPPRGRSASRVRTRLVQRGASVESSASSSSFSSTEASLPPRRRVFRRPRSVSPDWRETERETIRTRIRRESPSPSPPPPPEPQVVRGPTIEREVITHYTDVDHGVLRARQPSPQPPPRSKSRARERETEIDVYTSRNEMEVDVRRTDGRHRSRSRVRRREKDYSDQDRLVVVDRRTRRRAHSAAPLPSRDLVREEGDRITSRVDARGRVGEAYHGATRDWAIIDVPPGTERVTMDGAGGASAETTWQRYSGVRRTRFIPEREGEPVVGILPEPRKGRDRLSIHVAGGDREVDVKRVTDRRVAVRPKEPVMDTWTEITRDLVNREALRRMGYSYEERGRLFYITQYLTSREIDDLVDLTDQIRRARRLKKRQLPRAEGEVDHSIVIHSHKHRHHRDSPHRFRHERFAEDPRYDKQVSIERRREFY